MMELRTPRLRLEPVTSDNAMVLWRLMQGAHLREFQDVPRYTREEFGRRVAARPRRFDARALGRFEWLVVPVATQKAVGWVSLRVGDQAKGIAELGYSILATERGLGYATEAAYAIVDAGFAKTGLTQIDACCVPANEPSRRLLVRLGFGEGRLQRHGAIVRGRPVDILIFEMTRERWQRASASYEGSKNSIVMPASANPK
jgi:ribosomal-protein-alanine N-acetyltransferase